MNCFIIGSGTAHPERVVTNEELAARLGVAPDWISKNSGIRERRFAADDDTVSGLAVRAVQNALSNAEIEPARLDALIGSTLGAECLVPGVAPFVQRALPGCRTIPAFDLRAGCLAFLQSLSLARGLLAVGSARTVACFASEIQSRHLKLTPEAATLSMLFGDGAGAYIVSNERPSNSTIPAIEILDVILGTDGTNAETLGIQTSTEGPRMNGRVVILHALKRFQETANELLERHNLSPDDIAAVVCHQPNLNLLTLAAERLGIPFDRFTVTLDRFGNTSGAAHFTALDACRRQNRLKNGDRVLFLAFGAGFAWGGAVGAVSG
jgi:3-oxoacyl-[acyl-carrier-protein] synthase-3